MDINMLRSVVTVVTLFIFVGIVLWACSCRNTEDFNQAANLPFEQD